MRQLAVALALQDQMPMARQTARGALGIDGRRDRIRLAGQQQGRNIAVQGRVQIGVHRSARP